MSKSRWWCQNHDVFNNFAYGICVRGYYLTFRDYSEVYSWICIIKMYLIWMVNLLKGTPLNFPGHRRASLGIGPASAGRPRVSPFFLLNVDIDFGMFFDGNSCFLLSIFQWFSMILHPFSYIFFQVCWKAFLLVFLFFWNPSFSANPPGPLSYCMNIMVCVGTPFSENSIFHESDFRKS